MSVFTPAPSVHALLHSSAAPSSAAITLLGHARAARFLADGGAAGALVLQAGLQAAEELRAQVRLGVVRLA